MKSSFVSYLHKLLGKRVSKRHITEEMERHSRTAKRLTAVAFFPVLFALIYFYVYEGLSLIDVFITSVLILGVSAFMPDIFYLVWKAVRNDKSYVPSEKRIYSHRAIGLITYTATIFFLFSPIFGWKSPVVALFAFIGYWTHISTDKVELMVDRLKNLLEKSIEE